MNRHAIDIQVYTERGIAQMESIVKKLEQRIAQWKSGIVHNPRQEMELLGEVMQTQGMIEATRLNAMKELIYKEGN